MRLSLFVAPAVLVLVAATGCHNTQRVKFGVDGNAVAAEEPTYTPASTNAGPSQPAVEVMKPVAPAPAPTPAPEPVVKPVAAPVAQQEVKAQEVHQEVKQEVKSETKHIVKSHGQAGQPGGVWTVQKGDTLQKISMKVYGTTKKWHAIMKANGMADDKIRVGQKLVLPEVK